MIDGVPCIHVVQNHHAFRYLRDSPLTTLLAGGTEFLGKASIEAVICDQDMDVDEHTMFHILNTWVKQDCDINLEHGRALVSNINLPYIKVDFLNNVVRKCGFVDSSDVDAAILHIEEMLANQSPDEKEHVAVEGAGDAKINGIYVRMDEDIGLGGEEVVFVKEASEDDFGPDYGLYLLRSTWSITSCVDYSNILYSCEHPPASPLHKPPKTGWKVVGGMEPAPVCTWNSSKHDNHQSASGAYIAPNLADVGSMNHKRVGDVANGDHDEGRAKRLTLRTMCALPTDDDYEDDYDIDDSETDKQ